MATCEHPHCDGLGVCHYGYDTDGDAPCPVCEAAGRHGHTPDVRRARHAAEHAESMGWREAAEAIRRYAEPDRDLADRLFWIDVRLGEHAEVDCMGGGEYECPRCSADFKAREAILAEQARREAAGIFIEDPDEPTLEERLEPYGLEWQIEQRERMEGGW